MNNSMNNTLQKIPMLDFSRPWHIEPEAAKRLSKLFADVSQIQANNGSWDLIESAVASSQIGSGVSNVPFVRESREEMYSQNRTWGLRNGVATIAVRGPIVRYSSWFTEYLGLASTASIAFQLNEAVNHPDVDSIILNFDSPGGQGNGVSELGEYIYSLRGKKSVKAYIDGYGCSAAFWWAAACEEVIISDTGVAGSIGAVMVFLDDSKMMAEMGLKEIAIVSAKSPKKWPDPANAKGRAQYQELVDASCQVFGEAVAKYRGVDVDTVFESFGQGWVFTGQEAVEAGLCDRVGTYEGLLSEMAGYNDENGVANHLDILAALSAKEKEGVFMPNIQGNQNANGQVATQEAGHVSMPAALFQTMMNAVGLGNGAASPAAPASASPAAPAPVQNAGPGSESETEAQLRAENERLRAQLRQENTQVQAQARASFMELATPKTTPAQLDLVGALYDGIANSEKSAELLPALQALVEELEDKAENKVPATVVAAATPAPSPDLNAGDAVSPERQAALLAVTDLGQQALAAGAVKTG